MELDPAKASQLEFDQGVRKRVASTPLADREPYEAELAAHTETFCSFPREERGVPMADLVGLPMKEVEHLLAVDLSLIRTWDAVKLWLPSEAADFPMTLYQLPEWVTNQKWVRGKRVPDEIRGTKYMATWIGVTIPSLAEKLLERDPLNDLGPDRRETEERHMVPSSLISVQA